MTPLTEAEYLAIYEPARRIELMDGRLRPSPAPSWPHQEMSWLLVGALRAAVEAAGFRVAASINVRLDIDRIVVPDIVVTRDPQPGLVIDSTDVVLIAEIAPETALTDRGLQIRYAAAHIPWYLLVEPHRPTPNVIRIQLFRLSHGHYARQAAAISGDVLTAAKPFAMSLRPEDFLAGQ
ncbi:Uma2 family endonuclease [Actinoplanes sp. NPDC000266]